MNVSSLAPFVCDFLLIRSNLWQSRFHWIFCQFRFWTGREYSLCRSSWPMFRGRNWILILTVGSIVLRLGQLNHEVFTCGWQHKLPGGGMKQHKSLSGEWLSTIITKTSRAESWSGSKLARPKENTVYFSGWYPFTYLQPWLIAQV